MEACTGEGGERVTKGWTGGKGWSPGLAVEGASSHSQMFLNPGILDHTQS
jgi:hypothetical protein